MSPLDPYIKSVSWHERRKGVLGGSDATIIASGDETAIFDLWQLKTGRKEPEPLLSLPVLLGCVTEDLNRHFFEHVTGRSVWRHGESIIHPDYSFLGASLDGVTTSEDGREAYWEAKCVNAFSKMPVLVEKYRPQCMHVMAVGGWDVAVLSVILGNRHMIEEIEFDVWWWLELLDKMRDFWQHVVDNKEP